MTAAPPRTDYQALAWDVDASQRFETPCIDGSIIAVFVRNFCSTDAVLAVTCEDSRGNVLATRLLSAGHELLLFPATTTLEKLTAYSTAEHCRCQIVLLVQRKAACQDYSSI